jgi:hypothetical protein
MVYGNNSTLGNVLEVTLDAGPGFKLFLGSALFGAWANVSRYITYKFFNDDSQSSGAFTVLAGATTPAFASFTRSARCHGHPASAHRSSARVT